MPTKNDKMLCDFVVRYGNDTSVNRGFFDTYAQVEKEYNSIKLDARITWKQILWEPLNKSDTQVIVKEDSVRIVEVLGKKIVVPA